MHLVIMAAGEGSRMRPLTDHTPKPLLKICGKTIIEHNIDPLLESCEDIYLIVKYRADTIRDYFGESYRWKRVIYCEQWDEAGTGAAILALDGKITGEFIVVSGDDLYDATDILELARTPGYATLCKAVDRPQDFGIFIRGENGKALGIIEKPTDPSVGNLANIGVHKFDAHIFEILKTLPLSPRGEREITDLIHHYIQAGCYRVVPADGRWITIGYPWDLLKANEAIIGSYTESQNHGGTIEEGVTIHGHVVLEEGVLIRSGTYIEGNVYFGKWVQVGPYTHIRGSTSFGAGAKAGSFSEIKNSYIGEKSVIAQGCVIVDTISGMDVNFASGMITTNLRHDGEHIHALSKGKLVDTGRRKLGSIVGDGVRFGANTTVYPGRTIPSGGTSLPGSIIIK